MPLPGKIPFLLLVSTVLTLSAVVFASAQCAIKPIKPIPPLGCKDVTPQCMSDNTGRSYWTWICVPYSYMSTSAQVFQQGMAKGWEEGDARRAQKNAQKQQQRNVTAGLYPNAVQTELPPTISPIDAPTSQRIAALQKKAASGDANAASELGVAYENGLGVPQDYTQAAVWYRKAADQGNADAQLYLGNEYDLGHGVPQDYTQAAAWYRKAADQGNTDAQTELGMAYGLGQGVKKDITEAYFWLDLAASGKINGIKQEDADNLRDETAKRLTPAEQSQVQERAKKWLEAHPLASENPARTETQAQIPPTTAVSPKTILCDEANGCTHQFRNGKNLEIISASGVSIWVEFEQGFSKRYLVALVALQNNTSSPLDVVPNQFSVLVAEPKQQMFHSVPIEKVAKTEDNSSGNLYSVIMNNGLRANTIAPGQSIKGFVFFEGGKKARVFRLRIYASGTVYEFPFAQNGSD